jgi:histidine ammonia-lyase/tyrosine ammonia-lyase
MPSSAPIQLGPNQTLSAEDLERVAHDSTCALQRTKTAQDALRTARAALDDVKDAGAPIYGITTGFGPLVDEGPANASAQAHGHGLIAHLSTGAGDWAARPPVRATIAARLQALSQGHSAVRPAVVDTLMQLLEADVVPAVPEIGSVGASGDLTPLAHIARVCKGEGHVHTPDGLRPAAKALRAAGIDSVSMGARDALAVVNGTAFMTAYAALALCRGQRLLERAEALTGWIYALLGCSREALDPFLHEARGHPGQQTSATCIRDAMKSFGASAEADRPLQEVYSLRCAPQVLGAARDQLDYVREVVGRELNGVTDNPVVAPDRPAVLHGGNFQGQQVALAADALNEALTQIGVLAERQIDVLLSPDQNGGTPPLLAWEPGPSSGLAGAQLTATALVAELRQDAQMSATSSIPTNGDNQDIVSMGTLAARTAHEQTGDLAPILAVLSLACTQLTHLRAANRADGPAPSPPGWMPQVAPITEDRPLRAEIESIATQWVEPSLR